MDDERMFPDKKSFPRSSSPSDTQTSAERSDSGGMSEIQSRKKRQSGDTHRRSGQVLNTRLENTWYHRSSVAHSSSSLDTVFTFQRSVLLESFCFSHLDFTSSPSDPLAWSISHPVKSKLAEFPAAQYSISPVVSHQRHWMINIKGKISSNVYNKLI